MSEEQGDRLANGYTSIWSGLATTSLGVAVSLAATLGTSALTAQTRDAMAALLYAAGAVTIGFGTAAIRDIIATRRLVARIKQQYPAPDPGAP